MKSGDVCLVRDPIFLEHVLESGHPECPARLQAIHRALDADPELKALPVLTPRSVTSEELARVHARPMIEAVAEARGKSGWFDADTFYGPGSVEAATLAAGSTVELALKIWRGEVRRGFSLVRPPGHHATRETPMGFCLLNNVALAVAAIRQSAPRARLAVIDFDLHHGNGTQDLFYDDPDVLVLSSHRYPFYPGTGAVDEVGERKGKGTTVNFPLSRAYDDTLFAPLYARLALPMVEAFQPDMLIVSAGFDGHLSDPMHGFRISTEAYAWLAAQLVASAEKRGGKILFCLEGGYNPEALAESVVAVTRQLVHLPRSPFAPASRAEGDFAELGAFRAAFRPYFPSL